MDSDNPLPLSVEAAEVHVQNTLPFAAHCDGAFPAKFSRVVVDKSPWPWGVNIPPAPEVPDKPGLGAKNFADQFESGSLGPIEDHSPRVGAASVHVPSPPPELEKIRQGYRGCHAGTGNPGCPSGSSSQAVLIFLEINLASALILGRAPLFRPLLAQATSHLRTSSSTCITNAIKY